MLIVLKSSLYLSDWTTGDDVLWRDTCNKRLPRALASRSSPSHHSLAWYNCSLFAWRGNGKQFIYFWLFRFSVSIFYFRNMFCNHDAVKVFVCLRSVLSLFLLDHLHQLDNYDDRTVFPLIIKKGDCTLFTKTCWWQCHREKIVTCTYIYTYQP